MASAFEIRLEWDPSDRLWVSHVPSLGGLSSYGATSQEGLEMTCEAVLGYLETAEDLGKPLPLDPAEIRALLSASSPESVPVGD